MECNFYAYETACMIRIEERPDGKEILKECENIAFNVEKTLNMYDSASELSVMNREYLSGQPYCVSGLLFEFLETCLKMAELCRGAFDPTIGGLVRAWGIGRGAEKVPGKEERKILLKNMGYTHISLIREKKQVLIDIPGVYLDPGAAGKGYSIDLVVNYLRKKGIKSACIDFGGNLYVMGDVPERGRIQRKSWTIGIRHPDDKTKLMAFVEAENEAISTSSWYEHYSENNGKIHSHLIDPFTGMPEDTGLSSVTILSKRGIYADILSTAFYVLGEQKGREAVARLRAEGIECRGVLMRADGAIAEI